MTYLITFLEGIITFVSPCLLPRDSHLRHLLRRRRGVRTSVVLRNALGFVLRLHVRVHRYGLWLRRWARSSSSIKVPSTWCAAWWSSPSDCTSSVSSKSTSSTVRRTRWQGASWDFSPRCCSASSSLIGWTPCVGAFLGSALMLASQQASVAQGVILLLCYSAGLGIPFVAAAVLIDKLKGAFAVIKQHYDIINRYAAGFWRSPWACSWRRGCLGGFLRLLS